MCEQYPDETGVDLEASQKLKAVREARAKEVAAQGEKAPSTSADAGTVVAPRNGAPPASASVVRPVDSSDDSLSPERLDVDGIVRSEGIAIYRDQAGRLWTGLATYWIKKQEFDLARATFEEGIKTVLTLRDFTQIFDAYAEFSESYISSLMDGLADLDDEGEVEQDEKEMDECMKLFEELMDRRPFLVNEVLLRRNPNDVQEWEKRVALYGTDDAKVRFDASFFIFLFRRSLVLIFWPLHLQNLGRRDVHQCDENDRAEKGHRQLPFALGSLCEILRDGRGGWRC